MKLNLQTFFQKLGLIKQDNLFCSVCNSIVKKVGNDYIRSCEHKDSAILANAVAHTHGISINSGSPSCL